MKIRINKRITIFLLLVFICIISIPSALSMYREKQTKTLKTTITHPNYTLTADANGGSIPATTGWTGTGATATKSVTYDSPYGTLPTPTRNGYTFNGWTYGVNFTGVSGPMWVTGIADSSLVSTILKPNTTYKIEYDVTLNEAIPEGYAAAYTGQWGNIGFRNGTSSYTYQIANGGSLYSKSGSNYEVGRKYHLLATITTPSDLSSSTLIVYTAQAKNSNNDLYNIFGTFSNIVFYESTDDYGVVNSETINKVADDHTITANWNLNRYKITYDLQGGTLSTANPSTYNIETGTITLNNPTLTGYTFTGWTGSNGNTPQTTVTIPAGSTGDKAYIANWQANTYNVTFDTDGGVIGVNSLFSFDASTHTIDGTVVGATWGDDYLEFAGNDSSYVNLGEINSDYMTLQATFSIDQPVIGTQIIIGNLETGGGAIFIAKSPTSNNFNIGGQFYIDGSYKRIDSEIIPEVGKKYNVLFLYDGETVKLFVNGESAGSVETHGVIVPPHYSTVMALGGNPYLEIVNQGYFKGKIYNASVYSNPKKQVTYDSPYGTLPTPTRNGYIFKGWNGKNILNIPDKNISFTNNWYSQEQANPKYIFKPSTDYTLTFDYDNNYTYTYKASVGYGNTTYSKDIKGLDYNSTDTGKMVLEFTTPASFDYDPPYAWFRFVRRYSSGNADVDISNIQLEESSTATPYEPYYVTNTVNVTQSKDHTLKAIWEKKEATFLRGSEFNAKIKQLAGNENATYQTSDTNITSIVRSNSLDIMPVDENVVSTSDSNTPIYAWFNNGTLYYYTDAVNLYMNVNANYMFYKLRNVNSIDLDDINTTKTTSMYALFHSCLNLSNLDLSDFNTENVQQTQGMFYNCSSLTSIDLSSFDMSKVTNTSNMLDSMTLLKSLKTPDTYPTDSSVKITLPKLMVDASGNEYTELDNTSPTETTLYTRSIFIEGPDFNARIKQLAGNQDATINTPDRNITSIVRTNTLSITPTSANIVSTSDSYYPIYAWFNNGTLYYYSESQELYMNSYAYAMFRDLTKAVSIDLSGISTKLTTEMSAMFLYDDKLATLDLSNFDTSKVRQMQSMFHSCASLQELDLSSFDLTSITNSGTMFNGMTALKRLKTPEVIPSGKTVVLSKLLVDASGNEYTELNSTTPTETWLYVPATFLPGQQFNAKVKQLAGNQDATYETADTNITSIVRTNTLSITPTSSNIVSTSDSYYPIYAWYNNGVIYYYSEANNLYMNKTATRMFTNLKSVTGIDLSTISTVKSTIFYELFYNDINLETIDVSHFNTSNVTDMQRMFRNCSKIETLNLSNFNTAKVTDMRMMFSGCSSLETLNISSFRTPNVVYMNGMFTYTKLQTLDLSNFDMTKVTNTTDMLRDMSELEQFKTPNIYPSEAVIQMPQTLYDPSGNSWSVLDSSAPTETWLKLEYIPYSISYNLDGGAVSTANPTSYNINSSAITLNNPTRSGYAFAGWSGGKNIQTIPTIYATVTEARNTTIDQMFFIKAGTYTYTRNVDGVSSLRDAIILKDLNGNDLSDSSYSPNNSYYYNTSYQAWIIGTDSTGSTLSRTITIKEDCYIKFVVMFGGSSNTKIISQLEEGTTSTYVDKQTTVTIPTSSTGNRVYTANWTANNYTVTAEANGGSIPATTGWTGTGNTATKSVKYNSPYGTLPEPTRTGYTFKGWNGKNLYDSTKGINGYISNTGEVIGTQYKFNYLSDYIKIETGKQYIISANTSFYNIGYAFFDNNKTYITRLDNMYTSSAIITPTNNGYIRFWISYDNSTALNSEMISETFNVRLEEGSTATPYEPYYVISSTNVTQAKDHTLKAIWDPVNYEIQYDLQGGTVSTANPASYNIETATFTLNNPTQPGYTFTGWTGSNGNTPQTTVTIPVGSTGDKAYIANWQANKYTVTADANGGSIPSTTGWTGTGNAATKSVTYDSQYGTLPTPTRNGYTFQGWNGNGKNLFNMSKWLELCTSVSNGTINKGSNSITLTDTSDNHGAYTITYYVTRVSYGDFNSYKLNIKPNTTYTLSWKTDSDKQGRVYVFVNDRDNNDGANNMFGSNSTSHKLTFTTPSDAEFIRMRVDVNNTGDSITYSDFQLEEGTTATSYEPYYVTSSTIVTQAKDHTLTAVWDLKESTFLSGIEFNAKIKQIAGNQDATYSTADTNITSIVRSNSLTIMPTDDNVVSTSNSNTPIYAWFDSNSGTLYYYTDAVNLYMNANAYVMFYNLKGLTTIDLSNINTSKTTVMQSMFNSDRNLRSINVSNFDTSNVINMQSMFISCSSLNSLDISSFDMSKVTNTNSMILGMTSLKTLKIPDTYPTDSSVKITLPKLMIDASGNEYTELDNTSPTNTMLYTPATFLPGQEFNAKIKQLAGNQDATFTTSDTNITSIVRSNTLNIIPTSDNVVSTNDSYTPIYAWFNNGTLYYYSESTDVYFNSLVNSMFRELRNVESIDIENINSNQISGSMWAMFLDCYKLESLDLSNFNTTNVTSMQSTFQGCTSLQTLDLSNLETPNLTNTKQMFLSCTSLKNITFGNDFDTSNVTDMYRMFYNTTSLTSLDISGFDMSSATDTTDMLTNMSSLESLKTPNTYPSEATIQIPKTLYDPSGNGWSVLDSSSPTETWLHKMICKRATTLHTETCSQTDDSLYCSGAGYTVGGSKNTSTITYGSLGTNATTLNSGDAFTCDVNGDGTFNELTERFYYVGDYYNTTTKQFETDTGVLIYYNNVSGGTPSNTVTSAYDSSRENWHGPVTAISQLPTTSQWSNVSLKNNTRAILTYYSTNTTEGGTLPSDFSYSGYSARLLTVQEINHSLNRSLTNYAYRLDDIAPYYFENTSYSSPNLKMRTWLETTGSDNIGAFTIMTANETRYTNGIYGATVNIASAYSVRPAIEVNKNFLNKKVNAYLITYDTNGGSENTTQTVTVGDSLGSLSVPTKEGYTFNGWYTAASGGEEVTTATVPTATTTYYAHWTPINYNITYDLDGGEVETANPTTYNPDSNSITLNNPTKTGYTFAGWSGGKNYINPSLMKVGSHIQVDNNGKISATNKTTDNRAWNSSNSDIKLTLPAGTYTLSMIFDKTTSHQYAQYHIYRGTTNIYTSMLNGKTVDTKTFTLSEETEVGIEMKLYEAEIYLQIEEGSTATSYEPYISNETTLTIPSGSVGNRKYTANWTANTYTVTADANGGSIPTTTGWTGTGNTATKSVTYDSQYGTLPTPTRNGYTFKGWNGKNLLNTYNTSSYTKNGVTGSVTNNGLINISGTTTSSTNYGILAFNWYGLPELEIGKQYTFSISKDLQGLYVQVNYKNTSGREAALISKTTKDKFTFTPPNNYSYLNSYFIGVVKNSENIDETFTVQLEEGTVATAHEPYYVTSGVNVTQTKDHTLKAIWEMDTYEITYDLQGGTLASSNPATYNVETNTFTLNNPTLTGQTFIGWTGSNGNTPEVNVTIPVGSYGDKAYVAHFSPIYDPETRIRSLNTIGTTIADDDPDSNLRYIGSNPNNYVSFNGQKWRIIGVFNGKLKIIQDSIGNYSFDTSRNTVNNGNGVNQWGVSGTYTGADLMKLLNPGYSSNTDLKCNTTITYTDGIYNCGDNTDSNYTSGLVNNSLWWNAESGYCYDNGNYSITACDFTTTGLQSNTARNMIDNATWYLGGNPKSDNVWDGRMTASYLYNIERSNNTGKQCSSGNYCSDDVTRTTTWQGKVGLLYPSDYVYATSGGTTHNRNTCLTVHAGYVADDSNIQNWNNTYTDCKNNDWLFNVSTRSWTISPSAFVNYSTGVFVLNYGGYIYRLAAVPAIPVRPVVYLKSSIKFTTGDGSFNSPFNLIDTE